MFFVQGLRAQYQVPGTVANDDGALVNHIATSITQRRVNQILVSVGSNIERWSANDSIPQAFSMRAQAIAKLQQVATVAPDAVTAFTAKHFPEGEGGIAEKSLLRLLKDLEAKGVEAVKALQERDLRDGIIDDAEFARYQGVLNQYRDALSKGAEEVIANEKLDGFADSVRGLIKEGYDVHAKNLVLFRDTHNFEYAYHTAIDEADAIGKQAQASASLHSSASKLWLNQHERYVAALALLEQNPSHAELIKLTDQSGATAFANMEADLKQKANEAGLKSVSILIEAAEKFQPKPDAVFDEKAFARTQNQIHTALDGKLGGFLVADGALTERAMKVVEGLRASLNAHDKALSEKLKTDGGAVEKEVADEKAAIERLKAQRKQLDETKPQEAPAPVAAANEPSDGGYVSEVRKIRSRAREIAQQADRQYEQLELDAQKAELDGQIKAKEGNVVSLNDRASRMKTEAETANRALSEKRTSLDAMAKKLRPDATPPSGGPRSDGGSGSQEPAHSDAGNAGIVIPAAQPVSIATAGVEEAKAGEPVVTERQPAVVAEQFGGTVGELASGERGSAANAPAAAVAIDASAPVEAPKAAAEPPRPAPVVVPEASGDAKDAPPAAAQSSSRWAKWRKGGSTPSGV